MVPETVREHYAALAHKAGECIACGACSKRCPFGVDAVENMRRQRRPSAHSVRQRPAFEEQNGGGARGIKGVFVI